MLWGVEMTNRYAYLPPALARVSEPSPSVCGCDCASFGHGLIATERGISR
ncbi:MAG: hypothetical protein U0745_02290 [Polyangia bacterium]